MVRYATLSLLGSLPASPPSSVVRFFFGHDMEESQVGQFRRILRMLRDRYEFVTTAEAVEIARAAEPPDGRFAAFSFDDGFRDNYDLIAPTLDEFGARACFFVSTNFVGCDEPYRSWFLDERVCRPRSKRPMTWEMLRSLVDAGFEVGSHTLDHVDLSAVKLNEAERQILGAKYEIELRLSQPCHYFSWPYGLEHHFPRSLLLRIAPYFRAVFSGIRPGATKPGLDPILHRSHFEPWWPISHLKFLDSR